MKFFNPPTITWQPCKVFPKLNGNHFSMVNIFKLHKYQTFGLLKMYNMSKIWFANNKFSFWKSSVYDNGPSKMQFFNFCFFIFQISNDYVKNLIENPLFFIMDFQMKFYYFTIIFDLHTLKFPMKCILFLYFF